MTSALGLLRGPRVVLLDYGSGNLHSASRALAAAGAEVEITADPEAVAAADGLVVPGVGAFAACMDGLVSVDGPSLIADRLAASRPVLGICVGHQVLFTSGVEHGVASTGCQIYPGTVERLQARRLPHIGWNTVQPGAGSRLFDQVAAERFYFVHSYAVREAAGLPGDAVVTWAEHDGDRFVAAVEWGALASTQFHPEKSGEAGARLLHNWVDSLVPAG